MGFFPPLLRMVYADGHPESASCYELEPGLRRPYQLRRERQRVLASGHNHSGHYAHPDYERNASTPHSARAVPARNHGASDEQASSPAADPANYSDLKRGRSWCRPLCVYLRRRRVLAAGDDALTNNKPRSCEWGLGFGMALMLFLVVGHPADVEEGMADKIDDSTRNGQEVGEAKSRQALDGHDRSPL